MNKRFKFGIVTASTCLLIVLMLGTILGRGNAAEDGHDSAYRHFAVFSEVIGHIKSDYVEEPEMKNVTLGAVNGMLESIDPYASYLNGDQYKQYLKSKESRQADVGLILSRRFGYIGIVDAIPGSSADKEGLTTGDVIEAIDGVSTRDMPLAYSEMLMQGAAGSSVKLSVMRVNQGTEAQEVSLVRKPVAYPAVSGSIINNDIGYLKVGTLEPEKLKEIPARLNDLEKQGAKKLVLDLRDNAVGEAQDGIQLANLFLDKGAITYLEGQKVPRKDFQADAASTIAKMPTVVIANRGTGNAAEIAASALLDAKRSEVVGERTYGSASERKAITMEDGSAVILSVAKYYSADGKAIQDNGVTPTVPVVADTSSDDDAAAPDAAPKPSDDLMLRKAVEVLTVGVEAAKKSDATRVSANQANNPAGDPVLLQMRPLNIPGPAIQ